MATRSSGKTRGSKRGNATAKPAKTTNNKNGSRKRKKPVGKWRARLIRYLPAWILLAAVIAILLPRVAALTLSGSRVLVPAVPGFVSGLFKNDAAIAPLFTPEVDYWAEDIQAWADRYNIDPNLLATVMQIESCGHPTVSSSAGARGLFQVMPFHFSPGEDQLEPETNVHRGAGVLQECSALAAGDVGLALACYNGGPSVAVTQFNFWQQETRDYYRWGTGIYEDAINNQSRSATLEQWLAAGGQRLCSQAANTLGIE